MREGGARVGQCAGGCGDVQDLDDAAQQPAFVRPRKPWCLCGEKQGGWPKGWTADEEGAG